MSHSKAFTDRFVAALKPAEKRYELLDGHRRGLMLRVFPSGTKTFVFRYQRHGVVSCVGIGHYPAMPLRKVYEAHADLTKRLNRGEDLRATPHSVNGHDSSAADSESAGATVG
jgi:hypothetical protein